MRRELTKAEAARAARIVRDVAANWEGGFGGIGDGDAVAEYVTGCLGPIVAEEMTDADGGWPDGLYPMLERLASEWVGREDGARTGGSTAALLRALARKLEEAGQDPA